MSAASSPSSWGVLNDYTKTVVTVAAAFLAFTGTFSTGERLAMAPRWPLLTCWSLLIVAIAAALFSVGKLTSYLNNGQEQTAHASLLAANISYFALFLAVLFFMFFAIAVVESSGVQTEAHQASVEFFSAAEPTPAFISGSSEGVRGNLNEAVCNIRQVLDARHSRSAIVTGRSDRRELSKVAAAYIGSNIALAQQRADRVADMLRNRSLCHEREVEHVLIVVGGPRHTDLKQYGSAAEIELMLAEDRRVEVQGIEYVDETSPHNK